MKNYIIFAAIFLGKSIAAEVISVIFPKDSKNLQETITLKVGLFETEIEDTLVALGFFIGSEFVGKVTAKVDKSIRINTEQVTTGSYTSDSRDFLAQRSKLFEDYFGKSGSPVDAQKIVKFSNALTEVQTAPIKERSINLLMKKLGLEDDSSNTTETFLQDIAASFNLLKDSLAA